MYSAYHTYQALRDYWLFETLHGMAGAENQGDARLKSDKPASMGLRSKVIP